MLTYYAIRKESIWVEDDLFRTREKYEWLPVDPIEDLGDAIQLVKLLANLDTQFAWVIYESQGTGGPWEQFTAYAFSRRFLEVCETH